MNIPDHIQSLRSKILERKKNDIQCVLDLLDREKKPKAIFLQWDLYDKVERYVKYWHPLLHRKLAHNPCNVMYCSTKYADMGIDNFMFRGVPICYNHYLD